MWKRSVELSRYAVGAMEIGARVVEPAARAGVDRWARTRRAEGGRGVGLLDKGRNMAEGDAGTYGGTTPSRGATDSSCGTTNPVMSRRWATEQLDAPQQTASTVGTEA